MLSVKNYHLYVHYNTYKKLSRASISQAEKNIILHHHIFNQNGKEQLIAIYHCSIKIISRGKGKSAVAAVAYRAGEKITNEYDGITHDFTRKGGVVHTEILLPDNAPAEYVDRAVLWNAVEKIEKAKNSQLAREIEIALPVELTREQNISLVREYAKQHFVDKGMCADVCIHDTGGGNPHAHIMLTMRPFEDDKTWGNKQKKEYILDNDGNKIYDPKRRQYKCKSIPATDWNEQTKAEEWRQGWADICNRFLEQNNHAERIDHRSYERQGIDQIPTIHLGVAASAIELGDYASSAKDLINLTENLDNYDLLPGIQDDSDLGYYWIEESGIYDLSNMGNLASYFDYEKFGRDIQLDEYGTYTDSGYVRRTGDDFYEEYDGDFDNIPDEYRLTAENNVLSISPKSHETEKQSQGRILDNPGSYSIYQLKGGDNLHYYRFASYDELKNAGLTVDRKNYNEVYSAELPKHFTADDIFMKFNLYPPPEFEGHSLSVSDVIVMRKNGTEKALYVDIAGYKEIPEFLEPINSIETAEKSTEQNYNMIDGQINNTPTVDELEKRAKAGERISITELAAASNVDKAYAASSNEKKPSVRAQLKKDKQGIMNAESRPEREPKQKNEEREV